MSFIESYKESHQHPFNQATHVIGIPTILASLLVMFFDWKLGALLFIVGWFFQFLGHLVEGKKPSFFSNPIYLLVGPWWWLKKVFLGSTSKRADR